MEPRSFPQDFSNFITNEIVFNIDAKISCTRIMECFDSIMCTLIQYSLLEQHLQLLLSLNGGNINLSDIMYMCGMTAFIKAVIYIVLHRVECYCVNGESRLGAFSSYRFDEHVPKVIIAYL